MLAALDQGDGSASIGWSRVKGVAPPQMPGAPALSIVTRHFRPSELGVELRDWLVCFGVGNILLCP